MNEIDNDETIGLKATKTKPIQKHMKQEIKKVKKEFQYIRLFADKQHLLCCCNLVL